MCISLFATGRNPGQLQTADSLSQLKMKLVGIAFTVTKRKDHQDVGEVVKDGWDSDNCPVENLKLTNS